MTVKRPPLALWIGIGIGLLAVAAAVFFARPDARPVEVLPEPVPPTQPVVPFEPPPGDERVCVDQCGDGQCAEIVCLAIGCPCAETPSSCPQDCSE